MPSGFFRLAIDFRPLRRSRFCEGKGWGKDEGNGFGRSLHYNI